MADIYHALGLHMHQPLGNLIELYNNKEEQWDGLDQGGNPLPTGVYVWRLIYRDVTDPEGNDRQEVGNVTLLR